MGLKMKAAALGAIGLVSITTGVVQAAEEVNVYSYRQPFLVKPLFDAFTRQTGVKVNVVFAKKGLTERLKREGKNSPADLVFTVDIGRINDVVENDLSQKVSSDILEKNIPTQYRHPDGKWYGLTTRARLIYASKDRVAEGAISSYEDLADPKWKGKICTRSGAHVYSVALIASMIAHHGAEKAEEWLKGVKMNLARKPQGNDRAQVKAIKEGVCDLAIGNSYYMGKMLSNEEQSVWADSVNLVFPNQSDRGTHMNISAVALTKSAPNKENAIKLMEFLSDDLAQRIYSEQNFEYPMRAGTPWSGLLESWGKFKTDDISLADIAEHRAAALKMVERIGFDG